MTKRVPIAAILLALCVGSALADAPQVAFTIRSGERTVLGMSSFDNKQLKFKLRTGKDKRELAIAEIARLEFAPFDTVQRALRDDTLDVFTFRDGNKLKGVLRDVDNDEVFALMGAARSEQRYKLSTLVSVELSAMPLDVDRRIWGKGGLEFLNNALETLLSAQAVDAIEADMPLLADSSVDAYVNAVGQRLAVGSKRPDLPYEFKVVNLKTVNAFTVGGGQVYVYRGLLELMGSESELAGVLAHEIGHNVGRHTIRALYKQLLVEGVVTTAGEMALSGSQTTDENKLKLTALVKELLVNKYSRDDEREADYLGTYNLYQRGYDPNAMVGVFGTLKKFEAKNPELLETFLASHPSADERTENVSAEIQRLDTAGLSKDSPEFALMERRLKALPRLIGRLVVISDTLDVEALGLSAWSFELKDTSEVRPVLKGSFRAFGGGGNDIRTIVLAESDYLNFVNGHAATLLYDSGRLTTGSPEVRLPRPGKYFIVFDNKFSLFTPKSVDAQFYLEQER